MDGKESRSKRLTHRIDFRISAELHGRLSALVPRTRGIKSVSQLLRKILEEGKVTIETYDSTQDKALEELARIPKEIHAIGINLNQVTRRFHTEKTAEGRLFQALEIVRFFQQADLRLTQVITTIAKISEGWLPK
ncbi:hypothetical protein DCC81_25175 [Chitinophaga parva]|uniref:Mobilization protein n=1 Tax=Chitinophaga parva TaxID=2169414 RepID=A0A2T7BB75_9BACT|nr:hypothetical protein [Chitinophaga parva]PUZ21303.1 hypothetical protein DCC81_25175 [Chitinophaga parva]